MEAPRQVQFERPPSRCPFCHDGLGPDDLLAACRECAARHHEGCWDEAGRCSACGCERALRDTTPPPPEAGPSAAEPPSLNTAAEPPSLNAAARPSSGRHRAVSTPWALEASRQRWAAATGHRASAAVHAPVALAPGSLAGAHARKAVGLLFVAALLALMLLPILGTGLRLLWQGQHLLGALLLLASAPGTYGLLWSLGKVWKHARAARRLSASPGAGSASASGRHQGLGSSG